MIISMEIKTIFGRYILDSRGFPTVEAEVTLSDGSMGRAAVPSGASTGAGEALELRDADGTSYGGKGVLSAVNNINNVIAPMLVGKNAHQQSAVDDLMIELDGTSNKSKLGANAILAVSLATAKAASLSSHQPLFRYIAEMSDTKETCLPMPMMNIINGGKHAEMSSDIQEFMIMPIGASSFEAAVRMGAEVFHSLKTCIKDAGYHTTVGDEGGFAPSLKHGNEEALDLIASAVEKAGYELGVDIVLALDVAASELYENDQYHLKSEERSLHRSEMIEWYSKLTSQFPIVSIEDGLNETDWDGWKQLQAQIGHDVQLVGDDLLVTNTNLLKKAISTKAANAILIKPNQIGTLTETIAAVHMAKAAGWRTIMSHRSGETEDTTIAHLSVGLNTGQIKTGSLSRSDRISKYNELLRISEQVSTLSTDFPRLI